MIAYTLEPDLDVSSFIQILERSGLGALRPIADRERMGQMLHESSIVLTARDGDRLVGVSRAPTDFGWVCYVCDLAVDVDFQRQGIGRELVRRTHAAAGSETALVLRAAPAARDYYARIGMAKIDNAWMFNRAR
ncbi:MAG: GNAT family N-acetyltransferase [Rhodospirillaceae bacterium]|nr:GNAT family N-acetyltransferase [Rhodospirillaceae bacterium]